MSQEVKTNRHAWWLNAVALGVALTACAVLLVIITTRRHTVYDRTATREHALSPRTTQLLGRLDRDLTLVVAADLRSLDRASRQRTLDVLGQFESSASARGKDGPGRLKVRLIDTAGDEGLAQYAGVIRGLAANEQPTIDAAVGGVGAAVSKAESLAASLDRLQNLLMTLKEQQGGAAGGNLNAQYLQTQAAVLRVAQQDTLTAARNAKSLLTTPDPLIGAPPIDRALGVLKPPVAEAAAAVNTLHDAFDSLAKDPRSGEADKAAAAATLPELRSARDAAGRLTVDLAGIQLPRVLRVAKALQLRSAALLIDDEAKPGGGVGVTAIDVETLLGGAGQGVDLRARTEDLIAGAVASMTTGVRPIVCIVHGAPTRLAGVNWPMFQRASEQLAVRGIELAEWACALDREMPAVVSGENASRPAVFVTLTAQGGNRDNAQGIAQGIAAFNRALNQLIAEGRSVLLSVNLSQVPATGSPDPLTECLKPLGVAVDSGRPLLQEARVESRRIALPVVDVVDPSAGAGASSGLNPIAGALRGLTLRFRWPLVVTPSSTVPGVRVEPVVSVPADGTRWQESEWQELYRAVARQPEVDSLRVLDAPAKDSPRDGVASGERWTLAAAVEVDRPGKPPQRVLVVGANGWFLDDLTAQQREIDGRVQPLLPGNLQLLETGVLWLARQDDQLVRGATLASLPTIPPLSPSQLSWLRWLLIGIMPALVLAGGVAYRVLRR